MIRERLTKILPTWKNAALALVSAILLMLAFPDFDLWWTAWFALVPLMFAVEREKTSAFRSFILGWIFGTAFFFGTCWWLAYAPIHYAGFPPVLAYSLILIATIGAGIFPAVFAAILAVLLRRFGPRGYLAAPFVWVFSEFLRYWVTGNNWNAIAYSQALTSTYPVSFWTLTPMVALQMAKLGGVALVSFVGLIPNTLFAYLAKMRTWTAVFISIGIVAICAAWFALFFIANLPSESMQVDERDAYIVAIQPNVPMSGLDATEFEMLRNRQIEMAETAIREIKEQRTAIQDQPITVILPESPMNFMYNDDREFQQYIGDFASRNNVSVLFNSAEPDATNGKYFNSAVMVGSEGREVTQYDKIYLLPFGEAVPVPFDRIMPAFVGSFSYGREYDLLPVGDAKAGVMICFESHFGQLSRRYVQDGADVIIEMTNDGYLGPTPVLRQHLANAVFRAVETNRPVLRVTNVGVTAYINERGKVVDPAPTYAEATRVWSVSKSDGSQTFYVKYGDWFAWLCSLVTVMLLLLCALRRQPKRDL